MGFLGFGNKSGKINLKKIYTLGEAMEIAKNPRYKSYEFVPVDSENMQAGYRVKEEAVVRKKIEEIKGNYQRRNRMTSGIEAARANGKYRGIDVGVYNNYRQGLVNSQLEEDKIKEQRRKTL